LSKDLGLTHLERLNEKEANRYILYQAIAESVGRCKTLDQLKTSLSKAGIETLYKYKSGTEELQGISFKIGEYKYKGSEIDRKFSLKNLQRTIEQNNKPQLKPFNASYAIRDKVDNHQDKSITEAHTQRFSTIEQLMKPEKNHEWVPYELKRKKKKHQFKLR